MDSGGQKSTQSPPCGVTVIVELDLDNEEQKLTINSKSRVYNHGKRNPAPELSPNRSADGGQMQSNTKEEPSVPTTGNSATGAAIIKPKRLECMGNHFPELMPDKVAKSCLCCSQVTAFSPRRPNGKLLARHQTRYWCPDCETPLCISPRPCFKRYHTVEEYFKYVDTTTVRNVPLPSGSSFPPMSEYPPNQSEFNPKPNEYPPKQSEFSPKLSEYAPKQGEFSPKLNEYAPKQSEFPPKMSEYAPKQSEYPPKQSDYPLKQNEYPLKQSEFLPKTEFPPRLSEFPPKPINLQNPHDFRNEMMAHMNSMMNANMAAFQGSGHLNMNDPSS